MAAYPQQNWAHEPPPAYTHDNAVCTVNYQPQPATATIVHTVAAPPPTATITHPDPPEKNYSGLAICAYIFSICTLVACGDAVICLCLIIPAFYLSISALRSTGKSQKNKASCSICLNVSVVICSVVLIVAIVTPFTVKTDAGDASAASIQRCSPYYSYTYRTYCVPHTYSQQDSCSYYNASYTGYCYSACPTFYSYQYKTRCSSSLSAIASTCIYYLSRYKCPSTIDRPCPAYYSSTYSTRCLSYTTSTTSGTPCRYYVSYSDGGYCPR